MKRWQRPRPCWCSGYWFPHRKGGGACFSSPRSEYYMAIRQGATWAEALELLSVNQLERMFPIPEADTSFSTTT